jgi:hypothetical protein
MAAIEAFSSAPPHWPPPIAQAPKPISETFQPVRPKERVFMVDEVWSAGWGGFKRVLSFSP